MIVISTSPIQKWLTVHEGVWPWHYATGPPRFETQIGGSEGTLGIMGKLKLSRKDAPDAAKRLSGYSGCYRNVSFGQNARLTQHRNGAVKLCLERCQRQDSEILLFGYYCSRDPGNGFKLVTRDAEVLFEQRESVQGFCVIAFMARLQSTSSCVLVKPPGGFEVRIDVFSVKGHERLRRCDLPSSPS